MINFSLRNNNYYINQTVCAGLVLLLIIISPVTEYQNGDDIIQK